MSFVSFYRLICNKYVTKLLLKDFFQNKKERHQKANVRLIVIFMFFTSRMNDKSLNYHP
jgi:hypothetical protein